MRREADKGEGTPEASELAAGQGHWAAAAAAVAAGPAPGPPCTSLARCWHAGRLAWPPRRCRRPCPFRRRAATLPSAASPPRTCCICWLLYVVDRYMVAGRGGGGGGVARAGSLGSAGALLRRRRAARRRVGEAAAAQASPRRWHRASLPQWAALAAPRRLLQRGPGRLPHRCIAATAQPAPASAYPEEQKPTSAPTKQMGL